MCPSVSDAIGSPLEKRDVPIAQGAEQPLVIVSGASGVGKTSVVNEVCQTDPRFEQMVSCTTRPMRPGEIDGVDYHFLSEKEFLELERNGDLIESVHARGAYYGLPYTELGRIWSRDKVPIVVLDPTGRDSLIKEYPQAFTVFIDASLFEIKTRLHWRGDSDEAIARRLADNEQICRPEIKETYDLCLQNRVGEVSSTARMLIEGACKALELKTQRYPSDVVRRAQGYAAAHSLLTNSPNRSTHL